MAEDKNYYKKDKLKKRAYTGFKAFFLIVFPLTYLGIKLVMMGRRALRIKKHRRIDSVRTPTCTGVRT